MRQARRKKAEKSAGSRNILVAGDAEPLSGSAAIVTLILIGAVLYLIQFAIIPFVLAGMTAYLATPLIELMERRLRLPRSLAAIIVFVAIVLLAAVMTRLGAVPLVRTAMALAGDLRGTIERAMRDLFGSGDFELFGQTVNAGVIAGGAGEAVRGWLAQGTGIATFAAAGAGVFFGTILTAVVLFYFLVQGPQIADGLFWLVPPRHRMFVNYLWSKVDPALKRYFVGLSIIVLYSACASYAGLGLVLDLPHAFFLALMTGLFEVVPFIGPIAAATIAGLVALNQAAGIWDIVAYTIYAVVLRVSIDQVLAPLVLGRAGNIHPTLVIFCFAAGGVLFGFAGVLLAVPVALSAKVVLETIYAEPAVELSSTRRPSSSTR
jgi:predicted PurR-regulated permease PerM